MYGGNAPSAAALRFFLGKFHDAHGDRKLVHDI